MSCVNDDSGVKCPGCICGKKVIAVIPVHERLELLPHTISRLLHKNGVWKVICVGHGHQERKVCEASGAIWVQHRNRPLGQKWNTGFQEAKKYNPDAVLFVGSSDWLSNNWLKVMLPLLEKYAMVGKPDFNLLDISTRHNLFRSVWWPGYNNYRRNETIGIGRVLSRETLDLIKWTPFDDHIERGLDYSMQKNVLNNCKKPVGMIEKKEIQSLSISTDKWANRHVFEQHWENKLPSDKTDAREVIRMFPEAEKIFNFSKPQFNEIPCLKESLK